MIRLKEAQIRKKTSDDALADWAKTLAKTDKIVSIYCLRDYLVERLSGQGRFFKKSINAMSYLSIVTPVD